MRRSILISLLAATAATAALAAPPKKLTPVDVIDAAPAAAWRAIPDNDLLVITLEGDRKVIIQLAPAWTPVHVANIRKLAGADYWRQASVYRVQDNYVAQFGINEEKRDLPAGVVKLPPHEYWRSANGLKLTPLGLTDPYAARVGYADGWPVAVARNGTASLPHCYGYVGVARDLHPDTGTGGELYAIIGHAPRQLDRNIAVVGRVVSGIEHLSALPRGSEKMGFHKEGSVAARITDMRMAGFIREAVRPRFEYLSSGSASFARYLKFRASRDDDFYRVAAGGVDLCNAPVPVRAVKD